jgi:hypothetical protein
MVYTESFSGFQLLCRRQLVGRMDGLEEFEIDFIDDSKVRDGIVQFHLHWKGYSDDDTTWEPANEMSENLSPMVE